MARRLLCTACLLATGLLCESVFASISDAPCDVAYWDGSKLEDLSKCRNAAEAGDAAAECGYGLILWSGHDREEDHAGAVEWFTKSARHGYRLAQVILGAIFSRKEFPIELRNLVAAYAWFVTAGDTEAAERVKSQLNQAQYAQAKQLATEYRAKYAGN
jgi:TPR repeat protein